MSDIFERLESIGYDWHEKIFYNNFSERNLEGVVNRIFHGVVIKENTPVPEVYDTEYYKYLNLDDVHVLNSTYTPCHGSLYKTPRVFCTPSGIITSIITTHLKTEAVKAFLEYIVKESLWRKAFYKRDSVNKILERGFIITKPSLNMTYTLSSLMIVRKAKQKAYVENWYELVKAGVDKGQALLLACLIYKKDGNENVYSIFGSINQEAFPFAFNKETLINISKDVKQFSKGFIKSNPVNKMFKEEGRLYGVRGTITEMLCKNQNEQYNEFYELLSNNQKVLLSSKFCFKKDKFYKPIDIKTALEAFLGDN